MGNVYTQHEELYFEQLKKLLSVPVAKSEFFQTVVDAPFRDPLPATYLGLGIIMLMILNKDKKTFCCAALSETDSAKDLIKTIQKPVNGIIIKINQADNLVAHVIREHELTYIDDWKNLLSPEVSAPSARFDQANAGIVHSIAVPIESHIIKGALVYSFFNTLEDKSTAERFVNQYTALVSDAFGVQSQITPGL